MEQNESNSGSSKIIKLMNTSDVVSFEFSENLENLFNNFEKAIIKTIFRPEKTV